MDFTVSDNLLSGREDILLRLPKYLRRHGQAFSFVSVDVALTSFQHPQTKQEAFGYILFLVARGFAPGPDHYLTHRQYLSARPIPPSTEDLESSVREACSRLHGMFVRQQQALTNPTVN